MKKRLALGIITTLVLSTGVAMASPAAELEEGKWNVHAGVTFDPDTEAENRYASSDFDGDTSFFGGVTYGISDKWGVQIDYSHYDSVHHFPRLEGYSLDMQLDATEFNVLYSLNPNLSAYAGYVYAGMEYTQKAPLENFNFSAGAHVDGVQVGLQGWYPLGDKVKTFGRVGIGNNSRIYELGFSYAVSDNWDVDLSYRDAEYKDFEFMDVVADVNFDGVRLGISTSF